MVQAMASGKNQALSGKEPFASMKPAPPDSYPVWDPRKRMAGLKAVPREEARELSARSDEAASMDMHLPDPVVSLVVVTPVPTDFDLGARPLRVPVSGFREDALAYFVEVPGK